MSTQVTRTHEDDMTSKYLEIRNLLSDNIDCLKELIETEWLQDGDWAVNYQNILTTEEYLAFVAIVGECDNKVPQSLLNKAVESINNNSDNMFRNVERYKEILSVISRSWRDCFINDAFYNLIFKLNNDFFRGFFLLPNIVNLITKTTFLDTLFMEKPTIDVFEIMPDELLPYIVFLDPRNNWNIFTIAMKKLLIGFSRTEKKLINKLYFSCYKEGNKYEFWINREQLAAFLMKVKSDKAIVDDLLTISSKYYAGNCCMAFKLLNLYDNYELRNSLANFRNPSVELICKLNILVMLPKIQEINSLNDIMDINIDGLMNQIPDFPRVTEARLTNPDYKMEVEPFFKYGRAIALIEPSGKFEEFPVGQSHAEKMKSIYKDKCPDGLETNEFRQYEDLAKRGTIVFCITEGEVSSFVPHVLTSDQNETLWKKISSTPDGFDIYSCVYGKDFVLPLLDGMVLNKYAFLFLTKRFCVSIESTVVLNPKVTRSA